MKKERFHCGLIKLLFFLVVVLSACLFSFSKHSVTITIYLLAISFIWPLLITLLSRIKPTNIRKYFLSLCSSVFVFVSIQYIFYSMPKSLSEFSVSKSNRFNLLIVLIFLALSTWQQIDLKAKITGALWRLKKFPWQMGKILKWLSPILLFCISLLSIYVSQSYLFYVLSLIVFALIFPEVVFLFGVEKRKSKALSKDNILYMIYTMYCVFLYLIASVLFLWSYRSVITEDTNGMKLAFAGVWVIIGILKTGLFEMSVGDREPEQQGNSEEERNIILEGKQL